MRIKRLQRVVDAADPDKVGGAEAGQNTIMPLSFAGGFPCMTEDFQNTMAVSHVHVSPDICTTFACDPEWPEIVENTENGQETVDGDTMTVQLHQMKLLQYLHKIRTGQVFGAVVDVVHTVDFKKRGLPQVHILVWQQKDDGQAPATANDNPDARATAPADKMEARMDEALFVPLLPKAPATANDDPAARATAPTDNMEAAMDADLFVPLLPKLATTRVNISRQYMLQMSVAALRVTASQSVNYEEDEDGFFATIHIHVPPHEIIPQFETTIFAGQYCQTMDAALESASLAALLYMQKAKILIVDDLNFPELQKCQKEVVRAKSWSDIFQHEVTKLKTKINSMEGQIASLQESNALLVPIHQAGPSQASYHEDVQPQLMILLSNQEYVEADSNPQLIPTAKKRQSNPEEPDAQGTAFQQASAPLYGHQCAHLLGVAKKIKENSKGDDLFLSARTSTDNMPFNARTLTTKDGPGARRALFAPLKEGMDA